MTSTSEATQTALAAILARLEVGPVVPQVVVADIDYPPLPPTDATPKRKTVATKPNPTTNTATTTSTTTGQPSKNTCLLMLSKGGPPINSWLNASLNFAKLPGDLRKAMQGARIRTSAVRDIRWISRQSGATIVKSFKAWVPRSEAADKDKLAAISSFAVKTVTTIQRSPDVKARNFIQIFACILGGKTLRGMPTVEGPRFGFQTPDFRHIHTGDSSQRSLSQVKEAIAETGTCCTSS
ncbi:hypothetical protein BASA83_005359 [Batrachochytrium salamandrivorans]|nr:hypothetical protein BASA83_005359 [Batrachochytrium salamandrivorans]